MTLTPAMQQYYDIKAQYQDAILFFRMWDFYEMFENDAEIAHKILGIALTTRNKNAENPILLAGIPYHAKEKYLPLFVEAGYKVAIAEQVSDPKLKGIVQREVVRVVTPSTLSLEGEEYERPGNAPTLLSLVSSGTNYALSCLDIGKNDWYTSEFTNLDACKSEIYKIFPSEVILEKHLFWESELQDILSKKFWLNIYYFDLKVHPKEYLCKHFHTKNLAWYGIENMELAQRSCALLLEYLKAHQKSDFHFLEKLRFESHAWFLELDESTIRSLDLVYNFSTKSKTIGTLFWALDATQTPMGKRYLQEQILHPLQDRQEIQRRQNFIQAFKADTILLERVRKQLWVICDLEALLARLSLQRITPRDMIQLKKALLSVKEVQKLLQEHENPIFHTLFL